MDSKPAYLSKTLWTNLIMAVAPLVPGADVWIASHAAHYSLFMAGLNMLLRSISAKKLVLSADV